MCHALDQALAALDADRGFLKAGGVFTDDFIDGYIDLKMQEVTRFRDVHSSDRVPDVLLDLRKSDSGLREVGRGKER